MPTRFASDISLCCCTPPISLLNKLAEGNGEPDNTDIKVIRRARFNFHCPINGCKYRCCCFTNDGCETLAFRNLKNLSQHYARTHADKQFQCELCFQKFGFLKDKISHQALCCAIFVCKQCAKLFKTKASLVMHNRRHHFQCRSQRQRLVKVSVKSYCSPNKRNIQPHNSRSLQIEQPVQLIEQAINQTAPSALRYPTHVPQSELEPTVEDFNTINEWSRHLIEREVQTNGGQQQFYNNNGNHISCEHSTTATMTSCTPMIDGSTSPLTSALIMLGASTQTDIESLKLYNTPFFNYVSDSADDANNQQIWPEL
ncbi:hypothetical protein GJ496_001500 [Pomphorhynchus laevis]|nr:hypothetical protein GJ496_001500 [Pomphorhynchus laevis]